MASEIKYIVMYKKWIKIGGFVLVVSGAVVNSRLAVGKDTGKMELSLEHVEALASSESGGNNDDPCVKGSGYCLRNGIQVKNLDLVWE